MTESMDSALAQYLNLPGVPKEGQNRLTGIAVQQVLKTKDVWLFSPPLPTLRRLVEIESRDADQIEHLDIDCEQSLVIGDFGIGTYECLILDCSNLAPKIGIVRALRYNKGEVSLWEYLTVFHSLSEFSEKILLRSDWNFYGVSLRSKMKRIYENWSGFIQNRMKKSKRGNKETDK